MMNSVRTQRSFLLTIVATACLVVLSHATCLASTPGDCKGPVGRSYQDPVCSGPIYYMYEIATNTTHPSCYQMDADLWQGVTCSEEGGLVAATYADAECSSDKLLYSDTVSVTACMLVGRFTYLFRCNVTAPLQGSALIYANSSVPTPNWNPSDCRTIDNCTRTTQIYIATYSTSQLDSTTCDAANITSLSAYAYSVNECYYDPDYPRNVMVTCTDDQLIYSYYQNSAGCVGEPVEVEAYERRCGRNVSTKKKKKRDGAAADLHSTTIYCSSDRIIIPPSDPSSSNPSSPSSSSPPGTSSTNGPAPTSSASTLGLGRVTPAIIVAVALLILGA